MDAIYDQRAAAAGDDPNVELPAIAPRRADDEERAPAAAFAGRDDQVAIDELVVEIQVADADMVRHLRGIITDRMDRGDLSSVAAMRLYVVANKRLEQLRGRDP